MRLVAPAASNCGAIIILAPPHGKRYAFSPSADQGSRALRRLNPSTIHPPFANYAHGVEVDPGARYLFCSGQLGVGRDGSVPESAEAQARLCFRAIVAILGEAGMSMSDVVRINAYVSAAEHLGGYMKVRDEFVGSPAPASTLLVVSGFSRPEFKVEIEAVAAKA